MLSTGIPELQQKDDIYYLRDALRPDDSDTEASVYFKKLIETAVTTKRTQANDIAHIVKHR